MFGGITCESRAPVHNFREEDEIPYVSAGSGAA